MLRAASLELEGKPLAFGKSDERLVAKLEVQVGKILVWLNSAHRKYRAQDNDDFIG